MSGRRPRGPDVSRPLTAGDVQAWHDAATLDEPEAVVSAGRRTASVRLRLARIEQLAFYLRSCTYAEMVDVIRPLWVDKRVGRPYRSSPSGVTLGYVATVLYGNNESDALTEIATPLTWAALRQVAAEAWPDRPWLHLPDHPPNRGTQRYADKKIHRAGLYSEWLATLADDVFDAYDEIIDAEPGAWTEPSVANVVVGDATSLPARTRFAPGTVARRADGSSYTRRADPVAQSSQYRPGRVAERDLAPTDTSKAPPRAVTYMLAATRNLEGNERVIVAGEPVISGSDADVFVSVLEKIRDRLHRTTVAGYDMAMHGSHAERLMAIGLIPLHKVQRGNKGMVKTVNIGRYKLRLRNGETQHHSLFAVDGQPMLKISAAGEPTYIPLERQKVEVRRRYKTLYVDYTVPNLPEVPGPLRRAAVRIRHDSGGAGEMKNSKRPQNLRVFPEHEQLFQDLFGTRNDVESLNNKLKSRLQARRLRTLDPARNHLDLHLWILLENNRARISHRRRTAAGAAAPDPPLASAA